MDLEEEEEKVAGVYKDQHRKINIEDMYYEDDDWAEVTCNKTSTDGFQDCCKNWSFNDFFVNKNDLMVLMA